MNAKIVGQPAWKIAEMCGIEIPHSKKVLTTGAPRISPTHFMDSDGKVGAEVAPRRYFCLQCHVPQADTAPIVGNTFTPSKGYGK